MSDESTGEAQPAGEVDAGEPIAALAGFEHDASSGFLARFRRAIHRRTTVAQLTTFSASTPLIVLMEFWIMLVEQLRPQSTGKEGRRGTKTP